MIIARFNHLMLQI